MSRPLRIEYPDAWYHVMNRGRRCEKIFATPDDFLTFIKLLKEGAEQWQVKSAPTVFYQTTTYVELNIKCVM